MAATTGESVAVRVQSGLRCSPYYHALASGGSFVLGLALWTLPFPAWVGLAETSATEAKWVIWLTGTYSLVAMPAGLISSFYRTTGDLPRSQWLGNIQQVVLLSI